MEKYSKVRNIGKGNMGACVLAKNNEDGKYYVIKQIDLTRMSKKERQQSLNEAHLLNSLRHPNIINYVDSFLSRRADNLCIVMEFADSGDLSTRIKKTYGVNFSETQVLDWLIQLALSLTFVHQRKILHRDVKTQNVFLTGENIVKLGDFGIARTLSGTYDQAKTFVGTPYYLSPELILERPYDHRSDVWALGVVLYELLTLHHPFNSSSMKGLMQRILKVQYDPVPQLYSVELRNIVPRFLTKDPMHRIRLDELLELPIIQRRMRDWVLSGAMPRTYIETLVRQNLLPPAILALRKESNVMSQPPIAIPREPVPHTPPKSFAPSEQPKQPFAMDPPPAPAPVPAPVSTPVPVPMSVPTPVAAPPRPSVGDLPANRQQSPACHGDGAGRPRLPPFRLQPPALQPQHCVPDAAVPPAHQVPRRSQQVYLMYKNINGGYNRSPSGAIGGAVRKRPFYMSPLDVSPSKRVSHQVQIPHVPPVALGRDGHPSGRTPLQPLCDAGVAARQGANAVGGACPPLTDGEVYRQVCAQSRARKRSQQESEKVALCLNPFFHGQLAQGGLEVKPAPLPYLGGVPQTDIKALLQRAALERAQRRAVS